MEVSNDIDNKLPDFHQKVLIYSPSLAGYKPLPACRRPCGNGQWIWDLTDGGGLSPDRVTHWEPTTDGMRVS